MLLRCVHAYLWQDPVLMCSAFAAGHRLPLREIGVSRLYRPTNVQVAGLLIVCINDQIWGISTALCLVLQCLDSYIFAYQTWQTRWLNALASWECQVGKPVRAGPVDLRQLVCEVLDVIQLAMRFPWFQWFLCIHVWTNNRERPCNGYSCCFG